MSTPPPASRQRPTDTGAVLWCVDVGNTHTHYAALRLDGASASTHPRCVRTSALDHPAAGIGAELRAAMATEAIVAIAFCSVVPAANDRLRAAVAFTGLPVWQLTHHATLGVGISYPQPAEIGQDRLANAAAAVALVGAPAVVIDLGTAVTFDIITRAGGYEGGIIAPGPALMTRYLHERTAQLPVVDDLTTPVVSAIGRSTAEAMRIGAVVGFAGLIQGCLDAVLVELQARGEPPPAVLTSGGAAAVVAGRLRQSIQDVPDLTLRGLLAAWQRSVPADS